MKREKTLRKITLSDEKNKLKAVMKEKTRWGWKSKRGWKASSTDIDYVMYVVQSWNDPVYDTELTNLSEKVVNVIFGISSVTFSKADHTT